MIRPLIALLNTRRPIVALMFTDSGHLRTTLVVTPLGTDTAGNAPGRRGDSRPGACEMALVARALAGMPAQTRGPVSVDAAQTCSRRGRHRTSPAARQ